MAVACSHTTPTFGCRSCVLRDRKQLLELAKKTTPAPKCPECGLVMHLYEGDPSTMILSFTCTAGWTEQGEPICDTTLDVQA